MGDFLAELFDHFDPEDQARIRTAEDAANGILVEGTAAVKDRQLAAGSTVLTDWVLEPEDDARADAAGVVFAAHVKALWRQTNPWRSEWIQEFGAKVDKLVDPVLTRYGREGQGMIATLRWLCQQNVSTVHSRLQATTASAISSTTDSRAGSPQDRPDHASGHIEAADIAQQPETERGQSSDAEVPARSVQQWEILGFFESWGERKRRYADLNAEYTRRRKNWPDAEEVENLLKSARGWAEPLLRGLVSEVQDVFDLKQRVVKQSFDKFIAKDSYFWKRYQEFASALWEERRPSLEDRAIVAMAERATSAAKPQSSDERQPGPALDPLAGKGPGASSEMADQSRLDKIEEILKPHYAEIRDPDVRLPAVCECKSDADRAALAEGLRGRASVWATEALLAVLTNPDLPPIKQARFDTIVSKLIVRLAEDAAEFFSLDQYLNFPKCHADILAQLMEGLPKIAKDPSEVNQRRYLGEPMMQGTMPDLAQWRRQQDDIAIQKARDMLNSRPGWAQSQLALTQAGEDFDKTLHLDPWQRALNYYRATGQAWLEIVSDNETLQAFYIILPVIMEGVYWKCFGGTTETVRATSPPMRQFGQDLRDCDRDLRKRAAERAIRGPELPKHEAERPDTAGRDSDSGAPPAEPPKETDGAEYESFSDICRRLEEAGLGSVVHETFPRMVQQFNDSIEKLIGCLGSGTASRECIEDHILEQLNIFASSEIGEVTDMKSFGHFEALLARWCQECLPQLERDWTPTLDEATIRAIKQALGSEGTLIGTVDRAKLAKRVIYWKKRAIAKVRSARKDLVQGEGTSAQSQEEAEKADIDVEVRSVVRKPARRNPDYQLIDDELRKAAEARPKSQEEIFESLDQRAPIPNSEPFQSARGWLAGFKKDPTRARAWLSQAWGRLKLPALPRGPKK